MTERLLRAAGVVLLVSVGIQRLFAFMEFIGVSASVGGLDRAGLTIFQVQPLEPLMTLVGVALVVMGDARRGHWALWMGAALGAWSVAAGFLGIVQGMRLGLVQAQLQGRSTQLASFAFTMRIATQTIVPAAGALAVSIRAALRRTLTAGTGTGSNVEALID